MKITLDIPDGIIAGFFNGVEVTAHGMQFLWRLRHWNRRFSELYDELRKEIDHE